MSTNLYLYLEPISTWRAYTLRIVTYDALAHEAEVKVHARCPPRRFERQVVRRRGGHDGHERAWPRALVLR